MKKQFTITGTVIDKTTKQAISGLRVEAWDKDLIFDDLVGNAVTDAGGKFSISFTEDYFKELFFDRKPDLFFRVFFHDKLILETKDDVLWNLKSGEKEIVLEVDGLALGIVTPPEPSGAALSDYASLVKLSAAAQKKLAEKNMAISLVNSPLLMSYVKEGIISLEQKDELLLVSGLARLSGEHFELVKALKTVVKSSPSELIAWEKSDWQKLIKDKKVALPADEEDADAYAENMRNMIERSFPSEYFLHRTIRNDSNTKVTGLLKNIEPLLTGKQKIVPEYFSETIEHDLSNTSEASQKKIQAAISELSPATNTYRALGIAGIINGSETALAAKQEKINARFASLNTFYTNNPDIDLGGADFSTTNQQTQSDAWDWKGISTEDKPFVKKQMAAFQRSYLLADNHETGNLLMSKGFDSSSAITTLSEEDFLSQSGLGWEKGKAVYAKATETSLGASHYYETIRDAVKGAFKDIALGNQQPALVNDLREIDGYDELFGSQDFCDCEACRSVLSPAAYFADLMFFVQENVSKRVFIPSQTTHPLYLKRRRPDLWTVKLSCKNTTTELPYLQVVNEVLEKYLQSEIPTADVYETLRLADWSCRQPFNLPLEETRIFLSHFDKTLDGIYHTLGQAVPKEYREYLRISEEELQIIITPNQAGAKKRFGNIALANFNVQDFIRLAGISRSELDDLLNTKFIPAITAVNVKVLKDPSDIQKYTEVLENLTGAALDDIHRYVRLWKKTRWTLREFDLILVSLKSKGTLANLEQLDGGGNPAILQLALIAMLQEKLGLSAEEMATIVYQFPLIAVNNNQKPLYERIFDLENIFGVASIDPDGVKTYHPTAILLADKTLDKITPLLLAGLSITQSDLEALFDLLSIDVTVNQNLNIAVLSSLYRHACIARGLKLSISDFVSLIDLRLAGAPLTTPAQIEKLAATAGWTEDLPFSIPEMMFIIKGTENPELKFTNDLNSISATVMDIQAKSLAEKKEKKDLLKSWLLVTFNLTSEQLDDDFLPNLVSVDLANPLIATALNASFTNGKPDVPADLNGLLTLAHELERYSLLFAKAQYSPEMIHFFIVNKAVFGIAAFNNLSIDNLNDVALYHALLENKEEEQDELNQVLINFQASAAFSNADLTILASLWNQPLSLIASIPASFPFAKPALAAIRHFQEILQLCQIFGIQGDALLKLTKSDHAGLLGARNVIQGAFASKYEDEKIREEKLSPYNDKLNTLKRDALCDYIISRSDKFKFKDRTDLYNFFLLDVEMGGCFRTSRLVAAITSLQLYVHRCLINLEQSDPLLNPGFPNIKIIPSWIPADEWEWRKNYRVWEANRKVFLYPENYIDPSLRDNKTEIFKELEDELLQEKISQESAENAYKKYLAQFTVLTRLRYAGAYYKQAENGYGYLGMGSGNAAGSGSSYYVSGVSFDVQAQDGKFYLFARTNVHPYQYYYRTYQHSKKIWGNWNKIDMTIEATEVSSIFFQGKLFIWWTETQSKELNSISGGNSSSAGFVFKTYAKYSFLNEHGKWSPPQRLYIGQNHVSEETIFRRIWNGAFPSVATRDKTHDSTVEKFQERIFRKPYASKVTDPSSPIRLRHIWSHNKTIGQVQYTTSACTVNIHPFRIEVASQTFLITNGDFSAATKPTSGSVKLVLFGSTTVSTDIKIVLLSPSSCVIQTPIFGYTNGPTVSGSVVGTPVFFTTDTVSLSRNEITNPVGTNDILSAGQNITSSTSMKREYLAAFNEGFFSSFYVEDGSLNMSNHSVTQLADVYSWMVVAGANANSFVQLHTILAEELGDILFAQGLPTFLSLNTQQLTDNYGQKMDFRGPYGEYYWEMFFHIPFLIADHLNANQKFKEAKWWYERIFNPTADEKPDDAKPTDHNWQYREFRNLDIKKLKEILTDSNAIEVYKKDPFNPHAIARLRLSAYQKTTVMHYIDNLLDWGDFLFTQDTRESINEAEMLYQLAFDILGRRPVKVGKCETADEEELTYEIIAPAIAQGSEFLIMLENYYWVQKFEYETQIAPAQTAKNIESIVGVKANDKFSFSAIAQKANTTDNLHQKSLMIEMINSPTAERIVEDKYVSRVQSYSVLKTEKQSAKESYSRWNDSKEYLTGRVPDAKFKTKPQKKMPSGEYVKQISMVFCVPPNADLMAYWDRVEDRLYKIRHCMNIRGIRRSLSLFQPPIDPMLLVRARAAGLSMEDISAMIGSAGQLPAYRFTYLVEKAKQFTQTVQAFGSALLAALEKKDVEELTLLRSVHEKNILKMTLNVRKKQVMEAQNQYKQSEAALAVIQNRIDYYQGLVDTGLTGWEVTQQVSTHVATGLEVAAGIQKLLGGILFLIPQLGSPFAMKYGGSELGNSAQAIAEMLRSGASIAHSIAASASLEATFQRRAEEWNHQLALATAEYKQSDIQRIISDIRQQIAGHELEIHEKNQENSDELHDFYKNKFTNIGLYNYLASNLNRLYRSAYNLAYDMAKTAEQAYQFERFDSEIYIQADNWQFDRAGLLSGERLMMQLHELEKKFIDNNVRVPEITQTFSLAMLDPAALITLRQSGTCIIRVPEIAFEALYPGQYRRVIKSVRMTIPCIAGPYTNISARLTLTKGEVEKEDKTALVEIDVAKNTSITASSANNDSGVFDLSFRDERYLPFEGAGAISEWTLELPGQVRSFNYDTISDVLLHISYSALDGDRVTAEADLANLVKSYASTKGLYRLISMRYEFPDAFHLLMKTGAQTTNFDLTKSHFPYMLQSSALTLSAGATKVLIKPKKNTATTVPAAMNINGANLVSWVPADDIPMNGASGNNDKIKSGDVNLAGNPVKNWTIDAGNNGLDPNTVEDVLIMIKYKIV